MGIACLLCEIVEIVVQPALTNAYISQLDCLNLITSVLKEFMASLKFQ